MERSKRKGEMGEGVRGRGEDGGVELKGGGGEAGREKG